MVEPNRITRRNLLLRLGISIGALALGGCRKLSEAPWFAALLGSAENLTYRAHRLVIPRRALAQEFPESSRAASFRSNGTTSPSSPVYQRLASKDFVSYRLRITGLVEQPRSFSLGELRALPSRTQTTRHDCVEGWSAIGTWRGTRLGTLLELVRPLTRARFVVFHCADTMNNDKASYYESIDLEDACHPQTILAYDLNGAPLPMANGAPLRLRVERQLGYKMAKYVMGMELVEDFSHIAGGKGGYWEDRGYEWYAGI